jgi:hypothetical protein
MEAGQFFTSKTTDTAEKSTEDTEEHGYFPCSSVLSVEELGFSVGFYGGQGAFSPDGVYLSGLNWQTAPQGK